MNDETQLTPAEREALDLLTEECGEVLQEIGKIGRFGIDCSYSGPTNRERLQKECGQLLAVMALMVSMGMLNEDGLQEALEEKMRIMPRWLKHIEIDSHL
jgi:NTP pyrophosphatase (non-canonical NTP hydrolase)